MLNRGIHSKMLLISGLISTVTITLLIAGISIDRTLKEVILSEKELKNYELVVFRMNRLMELLNDMESGVQAFCLTGKDQYLTPFSKAEDAFNTFFQETKDKLHLTKEQIKQLDHVDHLKNQWISEAVVAEIMARRKFTAGLINHDQFIQSMENSDSKALLSQIKSIAKTLRLKSSQTMEETTELVIAKTELVVDRVFYSLVILSLLGLLVLLISLITGKSLVKVLKNSIQRLTSSSSHMDNISDHVAQDSNSLLSFSEKQSEFIQSIVMSISQIRNMAEENSNGASEVGELSQSVYNQSLNNKKKMSHLVEATKRIEQSNISISSQAAESSQKIKELVRIIEQIADKTNMIHDIVFQTKLLSFNASVEAARAGVHGKGFAVVAEEVGNLAQMSGAAAIEIRNIVEEGINKTSSVADQIRKEIETIVTQSNVEVSLGTQLAKECELAMDEVVNHLSSVTQAMNNISKASEEQSQAVSHVSQSADELKSISKEQIKKSEQFKSLSSDLLIESEGINSEITNLKIVVNGLSSKNEENNLLHSVSPLKPKAEEVNFPAEESKSA